MLGEKLSNMIALLIHRRTNRFDFASQILFRVQRHLNCTLDLLQPSLMDSSKNHCSCEFISFASGDIYACAVSSFDMKLIEGWLIP